MNRKVIFTTFIILLGIVVFYGLLYKTPNVVAPVLDNNIVSKSNLIRVTSLKVNDVLRSPLTISGEARGTWFFEATFPIRLLDGNGKEMARTHAEAKADWMTQDFVPFVATLDFQMPVTNVGVLVLEKDNPSGLPENADELRIPVRFK